MLFFKKNNSFFLFLLKDSLFTPSCLPTNSVSIFQHDIARKGKMAEMLSDKVNYRKTKVSFKDDVELPEKTPVTFIVKSEHNRNG